MKIHIIVGASAGGIGCANTLRRLCPTDNIIVFSAEQELPYNKCFLADYAHTDKTAEQITIFTKEVAQNKNIQLKLGIKIVAINAEKQTVTCHNMKEYSYDSLVLATGASPIIPPITGIQNSKGVFTFHTMQDVNTLHEYITQNKPENSVVIGAGLSGLECADFLVSQGIQTAIVEKQSQVMPRQLDAVGAELIQECAQKAGVSLFLGEQVQEITSNADNYPETVILASKKALKADLVVIAAGTRPNSFLAKKAGLTLKNEGVIVDDYMATNRPNIYAVGDVAIVKDQITGNTVNSCLWPDAMLQGMIVGSSIAGKAKKYPGAVLLTSTAVFGTKFVTCGPMADSGNITRKGPNNGIYQALYIFEGCLLGFTLVGNTKDMGQLKRAILTKKLII